MFCLSNISYREGFKMKAVLWAFLFSVSSFSFLGLISKADAAPNVQEQCGQAQSNGKSWTYCAFRTQGSTNRDVVFYFHGRGEASSGNERAWTRANFFPENIRARWAAAGKDAPIIFAVSFGSTWVLADRDASSINVTMNLFDRDVMDHAKGILGGLNGRILVLGDSMGGLNASIFAIKSQYPVAKLAALCPLIADISPFAPPLAVGAFLRANPETNAQSLVMVMGLGRTAFPSQAEWEAGSPLEIARRQRESYPFSFYSSAGRKDRFGIFSGAEAFAKEMTRIGTRTVFEPMNEDHCAVNPVAVADFLVAP
jgi:hypothetical protein